LQMEYRMAMPDPGWPKDSGNPAGNQNQILINNTRSYSLATFRQRTGAFIIDWLLISLINLLLINGFDLYDYKNVFYPNSLYLGLTGSCYFILFTRYFGRSPGKMLLGIKIVRQDGRKIDWKTVIVRELFGRVVSQLRIFYLGYFYCLISRNKQCWHDIFADTFVVQVRKRNPREVLVPINKE